MHRIQTSPEKYLPTVVQLLLADGMTQVAELLRSSDIQVKETGYDNWDGGTSIWTITLLIDPSEYAALGPSRKTIEEQISNRLKPVIEQFSSDWFSVNISTRLTIDEEWRVPMDDIPTSVRQGVFDSLQIEKVNWHGEIDDIEFLNRLYDLSNMQSHDNRYQSADKDIWQHRINNDDWEDGWVYSDERFNLLHCPTEKFLRFLCEIVHPIVRPDRNEALKLVQLINDQINHAGWEIAEEEKISGRPRYVGHHIRSTDYRTTKRAKFVAEALNASWMQKEIERIENAIEKDPALAIGTAKELIESCCKTILKECGVAVSKTDDLPKLTKLISKTLKLVPEGIPDQAKGANTIRLILRNLSALTQYLAELRGLYGTGHGRDGSHKGLEPRHARLAASAAVAFADFIAATYKKHNDAGKKIQ